MEVEYAEYLLNTFPRSELESLDEFGYGWLHSTVFNNDLPIARILLANDFDKNIKSGRGETPKDIAIRLNRTEFIELFE